MTLRTFRHPLLAAILVLLWIRPRATSPDGLFVYIGVFILLFTAWPWIARWLEPRLRRLGKWISQRQAAKDRAQAEVFRGWLPLLITALALGLLALVDLTGGVA